MKSDKEIREGLVDKCYDIIRERAKENKLVYDNGLDIVTVDLEKFIQQGADGVLYDLNRLEEVIVTLAKDNVKADMKMRMTNDLAMVTLVRYLLKKLEEK